MPQFSRRHLDGPAVAAGKFLHVAARGDKRQFEFLGGLAHELFIGIAAGAAQLMIKVCHGQFPAMTS